MVATPGRLEDFLDRKLVRLDGVEMLVLDESDRMLDMGFLPAIRRILKVLPAKRQTLCFSATLEASTAPFIREASARPRAGRDRIDQTTHRPCPAAVVRSGIRAKDRPAARSPRTREPAHSWSLPGPNTGPSGWQSGWLRAGHDAAMIHGDRSQSQRTAALRGFQNGTYRVLVATDIAARGVHVDNIAHVVNYDLPQEPEDFIHRVGRTGRASALGVASTFATRQESGEIRKLERALKLKMERLPVDIR